MSTCPECASGKHRNCDGSAWDFDNDRLGVCSCGCHPVACDPASGNDPDM